MEAPPHIAVTRLTQTFSAGDRTLTALADVSLNIYRGSFVSIIGPSGCGKSTLLKAIGGLLEPTSGAVLVDGHPPSEAQRRKSLGYVFQDPSLLPWRTVLQNTRLPLELNPQGDETDQSDPEAAVEAVRLTEFRDYYPHQLSGGMKQRVSLARALVMDPAVLLMDEPLGSLDEITRNAMRYEIARLWERTKKTVVFVTHSIAEAVMLSDRVVVLSSRPGRVLRDVPVDLPRPRTESLERSDEFQGYVYQIKQALSLAA